VRAVSFAAFWKGLTLTDEVKMINRTTSFDQSSNEMAIRGYCFLAWLGFCLKVLCDKILQATYFL